MSMKGARFLLAVVFLIFGTTVMSGHAQEDKVKELMKKKLQHSQKVLEGIALNDHDTIRTNADELILISKTAEWKVYKTPEYEVYSNDFRRIATELVEKAQTKNTDGAALAYVDLTLTCVKCHKHVREVRRAGLDPLTLPGPRGQNAD
jgi:cytochrome c556